MTAYQIWTDGSSVSGRGGVGFVIENGSGPVEHGCRVGQATCSEAEVLAVLCAFSRIEKPDDACVRLHTDFMPVIDVIRRGLVFSPNIELGISLAEKSKRFAKLRTKLVKSHSGKYPLHDRCHTIALCAARGDDHPAIRSSQRKEST